MMSVSVGTLNGASTTGSLGKSRVNYFGIEVERELTWKKWNPGQRYTKSLVLKNVNCSTQKLKFRVPTKDVFSTLYPKTITLSAGTSFNLPITFRPDVKEVYEDDIEFHTNSGQQFRVPVKALLPQFGIRIPSRIQMGLCSVHAKCSSEFPLTNTSELETPFRWAAESPFTVEPAEGILRPNETIKIWVTFYPKDAGAVSLEAVCQYGSRLNLSERTTFTGIAKYPQVRVGAAGHTMPLSGDGTLALNFGRIELGQGTERLVMLENTSPVDATVRLRRVDSIHPQDRCIDCPVTEARVPARTALNLSMQFRPRQAGWRSVENWRVEVSQGLCGGVTLECIGESLGPLVTLSCALINFHRLEVGENAKHTLEITNHSDTPQPFHFQCDSQASVFAVDCCDGVLKAKETRRLIVTFRPRHAIQYYRRLTCLIPDHDPLFLQLMGTCHNDKLRPHVLRPVHLQRFESRRQRGLSFYPPEELRDLLDRGTLQVDADGAVMMKTAEELEPLCEPAPILPPVQQFFYEEHDSEWTYSLPHLSFDRGCVDFEGRGCVLFEAREPGDPVPVVEETLSVKNNTRGTLLLQWMAFERSAFFRVEPNALEIPAGKTQTCRVIFTPTAEHAIYGAELEAFASFKTQREFQIVDEATVCPPWCLTVRCLGHTFPKRREPFLPKFEFTRPDLTFPSVVKGEATFRAIGLANCGDTPFFYRAEEMEGPFAVKPAQAVVAPGHQQIITIRCLPSSGGHVSGKLRLRMNDRADVDASVPLLSSADGPEISLDNKGELYFVPTNIGNSSIRQYAFKNVSRMPIEYEWKIRHSESGSISVTPAIGVVHPNEIVSQTWRFSPQATGLKVYKPQLMIAARSVNGTLSDRKPITLRVIGKGVVGWIRVTVEYEDFGSLVIGSSATRPLTLVNDSPCTVRVRLNVEQRVDGPSGLCIDNMGREPPSLELSETELVLPSRCRRTIRMTARPQRRVYYQHAISYHLLPDKIEGENEDDVRHILPLLPESQHLCHTLVTGVFPVLQVTDVQADGAARSLSKRQAWSYLSMDNFNVCLDSDPSAAELVYTVATRQSYQRSPPVYTRAVLDFNFGAAPVGAEDSVFALLLENPGMVATEFAFLFPEDLHVELEYWTETGEYTEQELHEMKVQEQRLFTVEPRKGTLAPGEQRVVELRHKHGPAATARLPVLMKIDKGREILINFVGVTVPADTVYLHYPAQKHVFAPVPIGEPESPVQAFELLNGGARPVHFEIDTTPLEILRRENNDMPIFECLTPTGQILPGRTAQVLWRFKPLEPRTYLVDIPIHVHNGDTAVITFTGIGFDRRHLGDTMPFTAEPGQPGVPSLQSIPLPSQAVFLSEERISFDNVPLYSRTQRVVFLNNRSLENAMSFMWHVTSGSDAELLHVSPAKGQLAPGQSLLCHVTFMATGLPRFFNLDLICEVTDETRRQEYEEELKAWDKELKRQQEEFVVTEKDMDADERLWRSQQLGCLPALIDIGGQSQTSNVSLDMTPYKTLPPIHERPAVSQARSNRERRNFETDFWKRPEPPRPFILHLGVTVRSHSITEFRQNFPERWPMVYMDRLLTLTEQPVAPPGPEESIAIPGQCSDAEATVVEATLANLLHTLVNDSDFLDAVNAIPGEEVPYFCQYEQHRPPRTATAVTAAATPATVTITGVSESDAQVPATPMPSSGLPSPLRGLPESPCTPPGVDTALGRHVEQAEESREAAASGHSTGDMEDQRESVAKSAAFDVVVQSLLENMVTNIIAEANTNDFDITARPRLIALPPRNRSANARRSRMSTPR